MARRRRSASACICRISPIAVPRDWIEAAHAGVTRSRSRSRLKNSRWCSLVFLALGSWRLARHNVLVRRSAVVETLGAVSMLCVDKTGTLTENRMEVAAASHGRYLLRRATRGFGRRHWRACLSPCAPAPSRRRIRWTGVA